MATVAVRIWLPDRPGALAQVATEIAGIGADVVGIEILERINGVVVDELTVELPREVTPAGLTQQLRTIDELSVESIRPAEAPRDTVLRTLDLAHRLLSAATRYELLSTLVSYACRELRADWAAVVSADGDELLSKAGAAPPARWVARFAEGVSNRPKPDSRQPGIDTASVPVRGVPGALVLRRSEHPLLSSELQQLGRLVDIADSCYRRLADESADDESSDDDVVGSARA